MSAYLKRKSASGKTMRQVVFTGERFGVKSVRRWRQKVLGQPAAAGHAKQAKEDSPRSDSVYSEYFAGPTDVPAAAAY